MANKKKTITPMKLLVSSAVTGAIVLSTRPAPVEVRPVIAEKPTGALIPVDRNALSHKLLPTNFDRVETENLFTAELEPEPQSELSKMKGPSPYEMKLSDQNAWGCQRRPVGFVSTETAANGSRAAFELEGTSASNLPIVPGVEDPHRWYEIRTAELDIDVPPIDGAAFVENLAPAEIADLPPFPSPIASTETSAARSVLQAPVKTLPMVPSTATNAPDARIPATTMRIARAWETGRY